MYYMAYKYCNLCGEEHNTNDITEKCTECRLEFCNDHIGRCLDCDEWFCDTHIYGTPPHKKWRCKKCHNKINPEEII